MSYSKYAEHLFSKCPCYFVRCPYLCDNGGRMLERDEIERHLLECDNAVIECERCE